MKSKEELIKEYKEDLKNCIDMDDTEGGHINADRLICALLIELGFEKVVEEYDKVPKWYA